MARPSGLVALVAWCLVAVGLDGVETVDVKLAPNAGKDGHGHRVLVTGGAGFIGSHLVDRLLERGDSVVVLDSLFTGSKSNLPLGNPKLEFVRQDVVDPFNMEVDRIFHLACPASPVHYKYNPVHTLKTSVIGMTNVLDLAKRLGARVVFSSTSEVYGDPELHPQPEDYWGNVNPIGERSCYDEGKRGAETLATDYARQEGVDVRIARIFNTYGPRMALNDGRVVSNFVAQALRGEPLSVQGTGEQTRSFCYVADLVDGLMRLMDASGDVGAAKEGPINLGNPGEFTIRQLASLVAELVPEAGSAGIKTTKNTADDPQQRKPVIDKAQKHLGWSPKVALREGLQQMIADFRPRVLVK